MYGRRVTAYDIAAVLPSIEVVRDRCKALAVLERILGGVEPYYAYTPKWGNGEAALMNNGSGDEWTAVFTADGAFIRIFDHESAMTPYMNRDHALWPGLLDGLPPVFESQTEEPAFADERGKFLATAVLWRRTGDEHWHTGDSIDFPPGDGPHDTNPDGSAMLEILLDDITFRYVAFAEDFYKVEVDHAAVAHVVAQRPLTDAVLKTLNPDVALSDLREDLAGIGYPIAAG